MYVHGEYVSTVIMSISYSIASYSSMYIALFTSTLELEASYKYYYVAYVATLLDLQ